MTEITRKPRCFVHNDGHNLFYRQIKMVNPAAGIDTAIGMSLHMILYSMKKEFVKWSGTHAVFYLEGRSWRKDIYPDYKAQRKVTFAQQSPKEQEDHHILVEAFDDLANYLTEKTNITVLQNPKAEADDMISVFIEAHPADQHVLVSSDSDFYQLLRFPNVKIYDPVKDIMITQEGIFDDDGNRLEFTITPKAKIKVGKQNADFVCDPDWYNYALFLKCIRGDDTDNIFSAYPGIREKGTKSTVGIREAYNDSNNKGYSWNNFMLQKFLYHDGTEHRVRDDYLRNKQLIDLSEIPINIKEESLAIISNSVQNKNISSLEIGHHFLKFCGRWDLKRIGDNASQFLPMLKASYEKI